MISIKEYDKLYIRNCRDLLQHHITEDDAANLQKLIIDDMPVFMWGNRCLIAQHWVGVISLSDFSIEILPKVSGYHTEYQLRSILTRMLLVAYHSTSTKKLISSVIIQNNALSEVVVDKYLCLLEQYFRSGTLSAYRKIEMNSKVIKGRILFNKQFKNNVLNPTKFECSFSKFSKNNNINIFLKTCLNYMKMTSKENSNIRRIKLALNAFEDIDSLSASQALSKPIFFNSTNADLEEAVTLGKMFLEHNHITINAGNVVVNIMLFDMNRLFELFMYKAIRYAFGSKAYFQSSGNFLLTRTSNMRRYINLRPDILVNINSTECVLIDTKWKLPKGFSQETDIYQMNAYSSALPSVSKVFLLYPSTPEFEQYVGDYRFTTQESHTRILGIRTVDLKRILYFRDFISLIQAMFSDSKN